MTSNLDFVRAFFDEAWANPPASAVKAGQTYLSDDFQTLDQAGNVVMNKEAYLGLGQLLFAAFKDYNYVHSDIHAKGDDVIVRGHWEGTHTADLDLSAMGMGVVPASGKKIVWPEVSTLWKVAGGKVAGIQDISGEGGIEGFLAPLGVKLPSA
jgi:predicted ester cyclase